MHNIYIKEKGERKKVRNRTKDNKIISRHTTRNALSLPNVSDCYVNKKDILHIASYSYESDIVNDNTSN